MARTPELDLEPHDILEAALAILREQGLDAVSMRNVAARLGVSPVPLYSRIGRKDQLLDALAEHLLADLAPVAADHEPWPAYALRWANGLRDRLRTTPDTRLILSARRFAYVEASRPLVASMVAGGMPQKEAVRCCRLLMWSTVGFVVLESGASVSRREADDLFARNIRYLVSGLERDFTSAG